MANNHFFGLTFLVSSVESKHTVRGKNTTEKYIPFFFSKSYFPRPFSLLLVLCAVTKGVCSPRLNNKIISKKRQEVEKKYYNEIEELRKKTKKKNMTIFL